MPTEILVALVAGGLSAFTAIGMRVVDWRGASKLGIGPMQKTLVETQAQVIETQAVRIAHLEAEDTRKSNQIAALEGRVAALESLLKEVLAPTPPTRRRRRTVTTEEPMT